MARVLCAWEFGGDLGHVRRLMPVAHALRAAGHEVTFALRDSRHLEAPRQDGFEAFVAPLLRTPKQVNPAPVSFSDILLNVGFDDRPALAGALRAWRWLFDLVKPDLLVADYAPTALIAARAAGLRRVTLGSGFSQPPEGDPLPVMRAWAPIEAGVLRALDDRLVGSIRAALDAPEAAKPRNARELLDAQAHLLCTFPELDPFGPRQGGERAGVEYVGPQGDATSGVEVRWRDAAGPRVFAYLKPRNPRFAAVLEGLRALDAEVIAAVPGLEPREAAAASSDRMRVIAAPVNLDLVLGSATLCVCHAGPGLAARALVAGVPMALLPLQLEQFLIARRLVGSGNAEMSSPDETAPDFKAWFARVLVEPRLREAAARLAATHRGYSFEAATRRAAERIAQVATQG
jgi:UDP:flavonoid glycosyltransferase YjiC (YdhE family)